MHPQVEGDNCVEAWARGVLTIRENKGPISPLITVIENPCIIHNDWWHKFSPARILPTANSLHGVVEMVGPVELTKKGSRKAIYESIWLKFDRARRRKRHLSNWHDTYFERLTRGKDENRIETLISKMNSWTGHRVAAFYAHTSSNELDSVVPIGNPCLQYVQFLQRPEDRLDVLALYRNHDFFRKTLGNFVGLGRLLSFVARETKQTPGRLTCISANAYLDQQKKVCQLAEKALQK